MIIGIGIAFILCMWVYVGLTLYCAWHFYKSSAASSQYKPHVSILIPVRNEAAHIGECLDSLLKQAYPDQCLDIVCVDDHSTDETPQILQQYSEHFDRISYKNLRDGETGKKVALAAGIEDALGEILIQIDGDCYAPPHWIPTMLTRFDPEVKMVAGPVKLRYRAKLLERLQALEIMGLGVLSGGAIEGRFPLMCNGANLAYRRDAFESVGGFEGVLHFASGDDELLLQKFKKAYGVGALRFCTSPDAIVTTPAQRSIAGLLQQRIRWVSKSRYYLDRKVNLIQVISYLAFWGLGIFFLGAMVYPDFWRYFFSLILLKFSADLILMNLAGSFFRERRLLWFLPLLEFGYIFYIIWIGIAGNFVKSYTWKGRSVN